MGKKQPVLQGFYFQPVVQIVDLEADPPTLVQHPTNQLFVSAEAWPKEFVENLWPAAWDAIKADVAAVAKEQAAIAAAERKRAGKAVKRTTQPTRRTTRVVKGT